MKDGSGLVRRRFVVRREEDSCLRATWYSGAEAQGRRNGNRVIELDGFVRFMLAVIEFSMRAVAKESRHALGPA